jgi:TrwC relaxase
MVMAKMQHNLKNAQGYFKEHLCVGDYYDQGQGVAGEWIGLGAERLGLSGKVRTEDFLRLLAPDEHLLMPFDQFVYADLKPHGEQQQIRLVFLTHEVSVRGDSLERIETIMQRKQLPGMCATISSGWMILATSVSTGSVTSLGPSRCATLKAW